MSSCGFWFWHLPQFFCQRQKITSKCCQPEFSWDSQKTFVSISIEKNCIPSSDAQHFQQLSSNDSNVMLLKFDNHFGTRWTVSKRIVWKCSKSVPHSEIECLRLRLMGRHFLKLALQIEFVEEQHLNFDGQLSNKDLSRGKNGDLCIK